VPGTPLTPPDLLAQVKEPRLSAEAVAIPPNAVAAVAAANEIRSCRRMIVSS